MAGAQHSAQSCMGLSLPSVPSVPTVEGTPGIRLLCVCGRGVHTKERGNLALAQTPGERRGWKIPQQNPASRDAFSPLLLSVVGILLSFFLGSSCFPCLFLFK